MNKSEARKELGCLDPREIDDMGPGGWRKCGECRECNPLAWGCTKEHGKPHKMWSNSLCTFIDEEGTLIIEGECTACWVTIRRKIPTESA